MDSKKYWVIIAILLVLVIGLAIAVVALVFSQGHQKQEAPSNHIDITLESSNSSDQSVFTPSNKQIEITSMDYQNMEESLNENNEVASSQIIHSPLGDVQEYEKWLSIRVPSNYVYDAETNAFIDKQTSDSFFFLVSRYDIENLSDFQALITREQQYANELAADGIKTRTAEIEANNRKWIAISTETDEQQPLLATFFTELDNGEYTSLTITAKPEDTWLIDMLGTFTLLPGDPYQNWTNFIGGGPEDHEGETTNADVSDSISNPSVEENQFPESAPPIEQAAPDATE